jgi:predicted amidohydrolase YtcJ
MPVADLILHNATVITPDTVLPPGYMVAIRHGMIVSISKEDDIDTFRGPLTEVIDCQGMTVLPGFNDAHCHAIGFAERFLSVNLKFNAMLSISDIVKQVQEASQTIPEGNWITVRGYNMFYLTDKRHPNRWDLDKATLRHPVKLMHRTGHMHVLNSLALKLAGITRYTEEPPGSIIERDLETGEPSGVLHNMGGYLAKMTPSLTDSDMEHGAKLASERLLSLGITSVQDASVRNDIHRWELFQRLKKKGLFKPRVTMMFGVDSFAQYNRQGLSPRSSDNQLRLGGVKIIIHEVTGELTPPQNELNKKVLGLHRSGHQVVLHAIEENTLDAACNPRHGHRHRIEHCSVCTYEMVKRLKKLKVAVTTQPSFIFYNGERYLGTVPDTQLAHLYPIGRLMKAGIVVAGSSDCPVIPPDPLAGIYAALSRKTEKGRRLLEKECISPIEAIRMYTRNAAYVNFEDTVKGLIAPGYVADIIVLDGNPVELAPEEILKLSVRLTVLDGKIVWRKGL